MTIINPARRAFLIGVPAVALGACATAVEAPKYEDALSGLHNLPGMAAPPDAPFRAGPLMALVFGSNIDRVLKQQTDADKIVKSFGPLTNTRQLADQDPQYVITNAVGVLKQRYPQIEGVDDLATAARRKFASAIVLDFVVKLGPSTGHQTTVTLVAIAFDARQQPLSRLDASGSATLGYPAWTAKQKEASDIAVAMLQQKVDRYWS